ncbi:5-demethoxyubiquinol-8 5-hydroxylase UbiM [Sphingomonas sp.]|uniref:5-demethoxyubiquinol-8 5-hydroxylase UbiM n=1 Tax=Sphingomonas sp. TaxID=28214 RepID=UPI003B3B8F71
MECDVIVVGAGPAGLAFARGLNGSGLRTILIERQPREAIAEPAEDGRAIALTHRSVDILDRLGAWSQIIPAAVHPLRRAAVLDGRSAVALSVDPVAGREGRLGQLVANHDIRRALFDATRNQPGLELMTDVRIADIRRDNRHAMVVLKDGRAVRSKLLVGADSRFSEVRQKLRIGADVERLGKAMLVVEVAHRRDHHGVALEWFGYGQTIALLPLSPRHSSVVLTLTEDAATRLARGDPVTLARELTARSSGRLGAMQTVSRPHIYPLATVWSHHFATRRAALIGDAAVGMHPVTAHGFNLGLRGATMLAKRVSHAAAVGQDIAAPLLLRRYEAAHRLIAGPVFAATAFVVQLYTDERPAARLVRPALLHAAARLRPVRAALSHALMHH